LTLAAVSSYNHTPVPTPDSQEFLMPDETTMRRLGFIRHLYDLAMEQSRQPQPQCAASILTFHDCVEFWLQLAAEHVSVGAAKDTPFMAYWQRINDKLTSGQLGYDAEMRRLNTTRADFKHHGMFPGPMAIEMARAAVTGFFEDSTPIVFGIGFSAISMVNLVACEAARQSLREANALIVSGQLNEALTKTAIAFAQLLQDYAERVYSKFGRYPRFFRAYEKDMGLEQAYLDKMLMAGTDLEHEMKVPSLELDYRRYTRFWLLTPLAFEDEYRDLETAGQTGERSLTQEDCHFCVDFVIDSAIRLQEFDFDVQP
jgi:hypothetical protein